MRTDKNFKDGLSDRIPRGESQPAVAGLPASFPAQSAADSAEEAAPSNPHRLFSQLAAYSEGASAPYPMHMPGHKRRCAPVPGLPYAWDVTEVPGTDNLHDAHGILAQAMARTAVLFGAAQSWYLVNGSTVGILAGVRALAPAGSEVLIARNCHKAVYHAVELGGLSAHWLQPPTLPEWGVCGSISPQMVSAALSAHPAVRCVVLTSPTYEGVCSDIAAIAARCHRAGVALFVDEAHGAHLGLAPGFGQSAVQAGADLVVQSAHKTLPSLTQTALLHLGRGALSPAALAAEVARQLDVFETSSPSYPLLASLDGCTGFLAESGSKAFALWRQHLADFDTAILPLHHYSVLCHGADAARSHPSLFAFDSGKLLIHNPDGSGHALAQRLREEANLETEMSCGANVLAMTSLCDDGEAFFRLAQALLRLDSAAPKGFLPAPQKTADFSLPTPGKARFTLAQALLRPSESCAPEQAARENRTSAEYVWAYPPGVPLIAPGETVTPEFCAAAAALTASGTVLHHSHCQAPGLMCVLQQ